MFVLELPEHKAKAPARRIPKLLHVEEFSIASEYARDAFVYRDSTYRIKYDALRRWAVPPEEMVRECVARFFLRYGPFQRVTLDPGLDAPDYTLNGRIFKLGEKLSKGKRLAELGIRLTLLDTKTRAILWEGTHEVTRQADSTRFESVVAALSAALNEILEKSVMEIDAKLKAGN